MTQNLSMKAHKILDENNVIDEISFILQNKDFLTLDVEIIGQTSGKLDSKKLIKFEYEENQFFFELCRTSSDRDYILRFLFNKKLVLEARMKFFSIYSKRNEPVTKFVINPMDILVAKFGNWINLINVICQHEDQAYRRESIRKSEELLENSSNVNFEFGIYDD